MPAGFALQGWPLLDWAGADSTTESAPDRDPAAATPPPDRACRKTASPHRPCSHHPGQLDPFMRGPKTVTGSPAALRCCLDGVQELFTFVCATRGHGTALLPGSAAPGASGGRSGARLLLRFRPCLMLWRAPETRAVPSLFSLRPGASGGARAGLGE